MLCISKYYGVFLLILVLHYFLPLASILISANRITAFLFFLKKRRTYANGYITERLLPPMQLLYSVQEKCVY